VLDLIFRGTCEDITARSTRQGNCYSVIHSSHSFVPFLPLPLLRLSSIDIHRLHYSYCLANALLSISFLTSPLFSAPIILNSVSSRLRAQSGSWDPTRTKWFPIVRGGCCLRNFGYFGTILFSHSWYLPQLEAAQRYV